MTNPEWLGLLDWLTDTDPAVITETDVADPERDAVAGTYWTRCDECRDWLDPSDNGRYGDICMRCALSD